MLSCLLYYHAYVEAVLLLCERGLRSDYVVIKDGRGQSQHAEIMLCLGRRTSSSLGHRIRDRDPPVAKHNKPANKEALQRTRIKEIAAVAI